MNRTAWKTRPMRMVRYDRLGEMLPSDPKALAEHARTIGQRMHANLEWVMATPGSAPGLSYLANFQTDRFEVNPAIGETDPIRSYVPLAHEVGVMVFAYINLHWYSYAFTDEHLDWEQRLASGEGYGRKNPLYGDGATLCINSGWREFAFGMIEEAMKTGIDGVFLDGPVVYPGCCYCEACQAKFGAQHGGTIPEEEDWHDPRWKQFVQFRETSMADFLDDARKSARSVNPDGGVFCNAGNWAYGNAVARNPWVLEDHQDITGAEAFFHLRREGVAHTLDSAQSAKFLRAGKNPAVVFTHHCLGAWHYLGMPDLEMRRAFYQIAACGASNWLAVFAPALDHQEEKTLKPVTESYGFLSRHEDLLVGVDSAARTALVHSKATSLSYLSPRVGARAEVHESDLIMHVQQTDASDLKALKQACDQLCGDEFSGFFYGLTRNHIPFDVVRDVDLHQDGLGRYDTVVLPNIACLDPAWCDALVAFARRGGTVIGSFESGQFDASGEPASGDFLRELFGVAEVVGTFAPAAFEEYIQVTAEGAEVFDGYIDGELIPRYRAALKVRPAAGAGVLAWLMQPIGQVYLAPKPPSEFPAILLNRVGSGHGVLLTGTFGESYHSFGFLEYEQVLDGLLRRLPTSRAQIQTNAPSTVQMELWQREGELLLHLVNNSGDMRRPIDHIHPVPGVRVELPGVTATSVRSARGAAVALDAGNDGSILQLDLTDQYDILTIGTV